MHDEEPFWTRTCNQHHDTPFMLAKCRLRCKDRCIWRTARQCHRQATRACGQIGAATRCVATLGKAIVHGEHDENLTTGLARNWNV